MNRNKTIAYALVIAVLVLLVVSGLHKRRPAINSTPSVESDSGSRTNASSTPPELLFQVATSTPATTGALPSQGVPAGVLSKTERLRSAAEQKNVPIDFWGNVIDQNGAPLAGVKIIANARSFAVDDSGAGVTYSPKTAVVTGADGRFEIHGIKGDSLKLEALEKEGYETEPEAFRVFSYEPSQNFAPNQNKPIVFKLWARGLKQPLVTGDKVFKFIPDGRIYALDFTKGTFEEEKNAAGDLQFWLKRPESVQRGQAYDWSFGIRPLNGGIVQELNTQYNAMTLAPEVGYIDEYKKDHQGTENSWSAGEWQDRFFVKTGGKAYGRIQVTVDSFYEASTGQGRLHVEYAVNPTGSPILR